MGGGRILHGVEVGRCFTRLVKHPQGMIPQMVGKCLTRLDNHAQGVEEGSSIGWHGQVSH